MNNTSPFLNVSASQYRVISSVKQVQPKQIVQQRVFFRKNEPPQLNF